MNRQCFKTLATQTLSILFILSAATGGITSANAEPLQSVSPQQQAKVTDNPQNDALGKKAIQVMELLVDEKYDAVREAVDIGLAEKLSAEQIEQVWSNLIVSTGPVKTLSVTKVINTVNADLVAVTADFGDQKDDFIVTFNKQGEIIGIDFPKIDSIDRIAEIFVNALANNDYPRARGYLHPFLKVEILPQQVKARWQELIEETGRVKRVGIPQLTPGSSIVLVPIEFEKVKKSIFLIFDDDGRITGVDIPEV